MTLKKENVLHITLRRSCEEHHMEFVISSWNKMLSVSAWNNHIYSNGPFLYMILCQLMDFCDLNFSLELWGYKRVEELIWVKTNQLQRIIRTGRTGHWLNHSKEHCLVGIKGNPEVNRNIDTDVIVAEVRETSRKPDEVRLWKVRKENSYFHRRNN